MDIITWGPFLEIPGNSSGPKANFWNQNQLNSSTVPSSQTSRFSSLTDIFIHYNFECKPGRHKTAFGAWNVTGTFENGTLARTLQPRVAPLHSSSAWQIGEE